MKPNVQMPPNEAAWNKGKLVGQKTPLKLKAIWALRIRLQLTEKIRDLALFNLAIDSKLRGCDLLSLKVSDIAQGRSIMLGGTSTGMGSRTWKCVSSITP
jgi:hypothetical protein